MKKIFIISLVLLLVVGVFAGIYNFSFKEEKPAKTLENSSQDSKKDISSSDSKNTAPENTSRIFPLTDEEILGPTITADGDHIKYYSKSNGSVYEISFDGREKKTVTNNNLSSLVNILWSPQKDKVISVFNNNGEVSRYLYNYATKHGVKLDENIDSIVWNNLGDKIIYKFYDRKNKKRLISLADPDNTNWKNLAKIDFRFASLAPVPQSSLLSFWNYPNSFEETKLQTVGISGGEPKLVFSGKFGVDYLWSPKGDKVLTSAAETKGSSKVLLAAINSNGGEYQNYNIPTLASKCAWSNDGKTIYYALPGSIPDGSVMPNDYIEKKFTTRDSFWKIDITTGKQERIVELNEIKEGYDAANLFLSPSEDYLFFVNRIDGKLYEIEL